ncbi:hypothetical protein ACFVYR_04335 [Streptomyces sp. NPDC058284]|uniref:hypothetical protein n=1 Tax=unclassified Streptomyces TaxID=2593676 RepID=UPI003655666A
MLSDSLAALAAVGGGAVVQAIGTDAWTTLRAGVARLFGRGETDSGTLARLDRTAADLDEVASAESGAVRADLSRAWRTRFEDLLDALPEPERRAAERELRALIDLIPRAATAKDPVDGRRWAGAGRDLTIRAGDGSVAAFQVGTVNLGGPPDPTAPGPARG